MGIIREILLNFNSFQSPQFFRFNGQPQFTNILGGTFTIIIRGLLLALLIVKLIDVFNYSTVISSESRKYEINQTKTTPISPSSQISPFIIAVEVIQTGGQQNATEFAKNIYSWTLNSSYGYTYLKKCTAAHWQAAPGFYDILQKSLQNNSLVLCLPVNFTHNFDVTQDSLLEIDLAYYCRTNCSAVNNTNLLVRPIIYNRLINPQNNQQYLTHFLDKRRYYSLDTSSNQYDIALSYFVSKYNIETDESLLPWKKVKNQMGIFIPNQPGLSYHPNKYQSYMFLRMTFMLTNEEFHYSRSFSKIFDAISLVGGLIPIFTIMFIWLYYYALAHFQMTFIKRLHSDQKAKQYGVFYFFSKLLYNFLSFFNVNMNNWKKTHEYHKMHKVVNKHLLDVIYLYKRLEFIQRTLEVLLQDHQKKVLHLMRNKTFKESQKNHGLYQMKNNLAKFVNKKKKQKQERRQKFKNNEIILEPVNSHKNLMISKQFEGGPISDQNLNIQDSQHTQKEKASEKPMQYEQQDSEYNQEVERQELNELKQAFASFQKLRRQAQDEDCNYYSVISRNILKKLDSVDRQLLEDLQNLLKAKDRQQIIASVMCDLMNRDDMKIEQSLFRKRSIHSQRKISISANCHQSDILRSSKSLRLKSKMINSSKSFNMDPLQQKQSNNSDK